MVYGLYVKVQRSTAVAMPLQLGTVSTKQGEWNKKQDTQVAMPLQLGTVSTFIQKRG